MLLPSDLRAMKMIDHSIKKYQLTEPESSRLEQLGVELGPSAVKFNQPLSRREMLEVWGVIWVLRDRTAEPENHIEFAVGDWLNAAEARFGDFRELVREDGIPRPRVGAYKHQEQLRNLWVRQLCGDLRSRYGVDAKLDDFEVDYGQSFSDYMTSEIDRECTRCCSLSHQLRLQRLTMRDLEVSISKCS